MNSHPNQKSDRGVYYAVAHMLLLLTLILVSSCRVSNRELWEPNEGIKTPDLASEPTRIEDRAPFEIWQFKTDLSGGEIANPAMIRGDEYLQTSRYDRALEQYLEARNTALSVKEREANELRIAICQLALGDDKRALTDITDYNRSLSLPVTDVGPQFSLLYGYAYGGTGSVDQSLAWFSRVNRLTNSDQTVIKAAKIGVRRLLGILPDADFFQTRDEWFTDPFINQLIGREEERRQKPGYLPPETASFSLFWRDSNAPVFAGSIAPRPLGPATRIGVLLPLTSQFGPLGESIKRGIEIAVDGQQQYVSTELILKDYAGDPNEAKIQVQQLIEQNQVAAILGPLLAESSAVVSEVSRGANVPLISFSKNSKFEVGGSVFRLGPTVASQIESLLEVCTRKLGYHDFAIVYPENQLGYEFASLFRFELDRRSRSLVYAASYPEGDYSSFSTITDELERELPDAVFLVDDLRASSRFISAAQKKLVKRVAILGSGNWYNPVELDNSRTLLDGIIFVSPFFSESPRPLVREFVEAYQAKYRTKPDFLAAQGFDAATMILSALKRHQQEGVPLEQALGQIRNYDGLTGEISVQSNGEIVRTFDVVKLEADGLHSLQRSEAISISPSYVYRGNIDQSVGGESKTMRDIPNGPKEN